mmetsp:Transcript_1227/g.4049  ORF Transcript_1227/g.4049 Transcript_1227/m.4049 type:complete len:80 (+) Transcript_1227:3454-3693(+)
MNPNKLVELSGRVNLPNVAAKNSIENHADGPSYNVHEYNKNLYNPNSVSADKKSMSRARGLRDNLSNHYNRQSRQGKAY